MGTVRWREDRGRYQLNYIDADGVRHRPFCAPGTTRRQAAAQLREVEAGVLSGMAPRRRERSRLPVSEVAVQWLEARGRDWSPGTLGWRERIVRLYILPHIGDERVDALSAAQVRVWLESLPLGTHTRRSVHAALRGMYRWAVEQGLATRSPMDGVKAPPLPRGVPRFLAQEEYEALLERTEGVVRRGVILSVRTGVRAGELVALRASDVRDGAVLVSRAWDATAGRQGAPKGRRARRVPLHPEAVQAVSGVRGRLVPLNYHVWRHRATDALRAIGVDSGSTHLFRHTFASWWVQAGGSLMALQRAMGHSTLAMVLVYAHLAPDSVEAEARRIWGV